MEVLFQGVVPKYLDHPEDTEDAVYLGPDNERIVICDGASESFDAKGWVRILIETIGQSELTPATLDACINQFQGLHDASQLSWSKAAAFERGSFSTCLIGQNDPSTRTISITGLGDSVAVLTDGKQILQSFPYSTSSQFAERPMLLAASRSQNDSIWSPDSGIASTSWGYADSDLYLLFMTDALGEWLFRNVESKNLDVISTLLGMTSDSEFIEFAETERINRSLRRDDTSLVVARLNGE